MADAPDRSRRFYGPQAQASQDRPHVLKGGIRKPDGRLTAGSPLRPLPDV